MNKHKRKLAEFFSENKMTDERTGLPKLPPKYYWKVRDFGGNLIVDYISVTLMFGGLLVVKEITKEFRNYYPGEDMVLKVRKTADVIVQRLSYTTGDSLVGNYPPRRLP